MASTLPDAGHRSVVVTGLGVVAPTGIGAKSSWQQLIDGGTGVRRISHYDPTGLPITFGGEVPNFEPKQYVRPRKSLKVMSREIQFAFTAADEAWQSAALAEVGVPPERVGVVLGGDMIYCDLNELRDGIRVCSQDGRFDFTRWGEFGMPQLYPLWLLKYLPNMPACHTAIAIDARAACNSIIQGETSALTALAEGVRYIERDLADVVLVGGVGYQLNPTSMVFRNVYENSQRADNPAEACRPYDLARDGTVFGEGAGVLVLESEAHAARRRAPILAHVAGYALRHEPLSRGAKPTGVALQGAMEAVLNAAGISPGDLAGVISHGEGLPTGDRIEATTLNIVVGQTPVTSIKGATGHLEAGSAAVELVTAVQALQHGYLPPTRNCRDLDPACPIRVVRDQPLKIDRPYLLKTTWSRTGQAAAVLLRRPD